MGPASIPATMKRFQKRGLRIEVLACIMNEPKLQMAMEDMYRMKDQRILCSFLLDIPKMVKIIYGMNAIAGIIDEMLIIIA
jgi:nucleoside diphosphate kinase